MTYSSSSDFVNIYINFTNELIQNGTVNSIHEIKDLEVFRIFRGQNLINFEDAKIVDETLFGHSGDFWTSSYNYPSEGDYINNNFISNGIAFNIGLLTFNIDELKN